MDKIQADVADIQHLVPQGQLEVPLTAETVVLCIHRGRGVLDPATGARQIHPFAARYQNGERERYYEGDYKDTYDGRHFIIVPGFFRTEYGAALHFQRRAVVPGSRNPETNFQASFIAIIGIAEPAQDGGFAIVRPVDDRASWAPFTDAECAEYSVAGDALDRGAMVNPIDRDVQIVGVNERISGKPASASPATASRVKGGGGPVRRGRGTQVEITDPEILQPIPADENRVLQEARASAAERGGTD